MVCRWCLAFGFLLYASMVSADDKAVPADDPLFGSIPVVEAAALHSQTLQEAPADVTVVTAEEIHRYGYRTLNDALAYVRGFFTSQDGIYHYVGVRGFSLLGDFNTRFLVMLNGHPLTDQVYDSNGFFGQDLGIDMDLVSRIEIIRGPSSALFGSNGMLANINIVTKSPVDLDKYSVSVEADSSGAKKTSVSSSVYLGKGANLLVSASVFNDDGGALRFPGVINPVSGVNGQKGYHTFANLVWRNWTVTAYFNARAKQPPVPWGTSAVLFQRGDSVDDSRNFLQAEYNRDLGPGKLHWQIYYDNYRYRDRFYYPINDPVNDASASLEDVRSIARADSIGSQLTWQTEFVRVGEFTVGAEFDGQLRNLQQVYTEAPSASYFPAITDPDDTSATFVQQQWKISRALTAYGGARLDYSRNFGFNLSPRLAVVYRLSPKTTYKLVYGRPFRNPSAFERDFTDGGASFLSNPGLRPESAQTLEGSVERKVRSNVSVILNVYDYRLSRLIVANFLAGDVQQYQNTGSSDSSGAEIEVRAKARSGLEADASYSFGHVVQGGNSDPGDQPSQIAKLRIATPIRRMFWFAFAFQYMSTRLDVNGTPVRPVALGDVTLSSSKPFNGWDVMAGIRNVAGWRYFDPAAVSLPQIPGEGRSFFIKLTRHIVQ